MQLSKRTQRWIMEVAIVLLGLWAIAAFQGRNLPEGRAPDFVLKDLTGASIDSASLRGKPTLLVFWAPWCGVCRVTSQNVSWVQSLTKGRANVLSIASDYQNEAQVRAYVAQHEVDYPVLLGARQTARAYGVHAYPTVFFLDTRGNISRAVIGYTSTLGMLLRL